MDSSSCSSSSSSIVGGGAAVPQTLTLESRSLFTEGISLVLSRWTALQMAIENQWGGKDSRHKSLDLAASILSWFSHSSKEPLYIDDLENILDETMAVSFNTEIEDGSVEEVAEELMVMYEDCLKGDYASIEKLRNCAPRINAVSQSKMVINDGDDGSSDEEASDMMVDEPITPKEVIDKPMTKDLPDEEGWSVVAPRRSRGKKSG